jgi:TnpA family transposase
MTAIERTAYPRFKQSLTQDELDEFYTPTAEEIAFAGSITLEESYALYPVIFLKAFQKLGYLPQLSQIPEQIKVHIAQYLGQPQPGDEDGVSSTTRSRYRQAIRDRLEVKPYSEGGAGVIEKIVDEAAQTMSDPADLINVAIEQLIVSRFELPAFGTLDEYVNHIRHHAHLRLYDQVAALLTEEQKEVLNTLLVRADGETRYPFTRLKALPRTASLKQVRLWEKHLAWLESIFDTQPFIAGLASTLVEQFAGQAYQMEVSDIKGVLTAEKRYTLLLCLLYQMQVRTRDQLVVMYLKRIRLLHNNAKRRLSALHDQQRDLSEMMVDAFAEIVHQAEETGHQLEEGKEENEDILLGRYVRGVLQANGGTKKLKEECEMLQAYHNNNYLPLLRKLYRQHRSLPFRLTKQLKVRSATRSRILLQALDFIHEHRHKQGDTLPAEISLAFVSSRWHTLIREKVDGQIVFNRHYLEICIFSYIADGLRSGDLYVEGAEMYADYRTQLLSWTECKPILKDYCQALSLPTSAGDFVSTLRRRFIQLAQRVDKAQEQESDLYFDSDGKPHLRQLVRLPDPEMAKFLEDMVKARMPERHLLDILNRTHHWVRYTRHFGPPSGSDPKLKDPLSHYLITIFGYGCDLGPTQTARHARSVASARVVGRINDQHVTTDKLDKALRDIINEYARFQLPFVWGTGKAAIADGTHYELYENNLLGERHIRYGGYGGIAYHHISDTYIALFSHFIACGVWEAVYILDGLLKNKSVLQPDTVHADTQGQSEVVFGLAHLLGIQLMPRMRNWDKVTMYRPDPNLIFEHIDAWFTRYVNWDLIEEYWQYLMQVVLSIHKGKVLPSWLLQKLTTNSPKNKLYRAFRELGVVIRTMFLLEFVSNSPLRRQIRAATTKIEAYNGFSQWIRFGGDGILKPRDPVEHEKSIKYKDLIANAIMLQNVVDMTDALHDIVQEGHVVTSEMVATLSPYLTKHIKRFGEYVIDTETIPPPLQPDKPFLTPILA